MDGCSLDLISHGKGSFRIFLSESDREQGSVERIINNFSARNGIFADLSYKFILNTKGFAIKGVHVYVNDSYEYSTYNNDNGEICFPAKGKDIGDRKIFLDCYGFVELTLSLVLDDDTEKMWFSDYLPVLVKKGELNDSVEAMVKYICNHQETLLFNGVPKPKNMVGLKDGEYKNLDMQILLAQDIAVIYESNYAYFKMNSRSQLKKNSVIEQFERLNCITSATLEYIVSHPEELKAVSAEVGIRIRNQVFQPRKTLLLQNVNSCDIYENRIVLGFLRKMIDEVGKLRERCEVLLQQIPKLPASGDLSVEYVYSPFFMFAETQRALEKGVQRLSTLYSKFAKLWRMYQDSLSISVDILNVVPRPTAVFMSVPQYKRIFVNIHKWFNFGGYDLGKEKFMLSFIKISFLYENYLLAKMVAYFEVRGYNLKDVRCCKYPIKSNWLHKNTQCNNTFRFIKEDIVLTLYYQPVIFSTNQKNVNGVGLYRNNSISIGRRDEESKYLGGEYYVPDYLVKVDDESKHVSKYLIMDAKFSAENSVRKYYLKDLAFKYLFSVSPIDDVDRVIGMCIIYGKCKEKERSQSVYDRQFPDTIITPIAEILPLIEGVGTGEHYNRLDALFKKFLG